MARGTVEAVPDPRAGLRVAVGRAIAASSVGCSLAGLGIYLALGLQERLFVDWLIQTSVLGLLLAALSWPLIHRQPRNGAVWALLWLTATSSTQALTTGLLQRDLAALGRSPDLARIVPAELPLTTALHHQTASWGWVAGNFAFIFALLLFPDGRLPSPRWRVVAYGVGLGGAVAVAQMAWIGRPSSSITPMADDPFAVLSPGWRIAMATWMVVAGVGVVLALAALVARYRASAGEVRAQLRWIAWASGLLVAEVLVLFPLMFTGPQLDIYRYTSLITFSVFLGAYVVAISRYRLYDIDRLISRTVSYGLVTAILAGVYVGAVLAAQVVVGTNGQERPATVVAGSTLLVAALFGPVRRRAQQVVDRRFNRRVRDGTEVLAAFGERLRDDITMGTLAEELRQATANVAQPTSVGIWLPARGRGPTGARASGPVRRHSR